MAPQGRKRDQRRNKHVPDFQKDSGAVNKATTSEGIVSSVKRMFKCPKQMTTGTKSRRELAMSRIGAVNSSSSTSTSASSNTNANGIWYVFSLSQTSSSCKCRKKYKYDSDFDMDNDSTKSKKESVKQFDKSLDKVEAKSAEETQPGNKKEMKKRRKKARADNFVDDALSDADITTPDYSNSEIEPSDSSKSSTGNMSTVTLDDVQNLVLGTRTIKTEDTTDASKLQNFRKGRSKELVPKVSPSIHSQSTPSVSSKSNSPDQRNDHVTTAINAPLNEPPRTMFHGKPVNTRPGACNRSSNSQEMKKAPSPIRLTAKQGGSPSKSSSNPIRKNSNWMNDYSESDISDFENRLNYYSKFDNNSKHEIIDSDKSSTNAETSINGKRKSVEHCNMRHSKKISLPTELTTAANNGAASTVENPSIESFPSPIVGRQISSSTSKQRRIEGTTPTEREDVIAVKPLFNQSPDVSGHEAMPPPPPIESPSEWTDYRDVSAEKERNFQVFEDTPDIMYGHNYYNPNGTSQCHSHSNINYPEHNISHDFHRPGTPPATKKMSADAQDFEPASTNMTINPDNDTSNGNFTNMLNKLNQQNQPNSIVNQQNQTNIIQNNITNNVNVTNNILQQNQNVLNNIQNNIQKFSLSAANDLIVKHNIFLNVTGVPEGNSSDDCENKGMGVDLLELSNNNDSNANADRNTLHNNSTTDPSSSIASHSGLTSAKNSNKDGVTSSRVSSKNTNSSFINNSKATNSSGDDPMQFIRPNREMYRAPAFPGESKRSNEATGSKSKIAERVERGRGAGVKKNDNRLTRDEVNVLAKLAPAIRSQAESSASTTEAKHSTQTSTKPCPTLENTDTLTDIRPSLRKRWADIGDDDEDEDEVDIHPKTATKTFVGAKKADSTGSHTRTEDLSTGTQTIKKKKKERLSPSAHSMLSSLQSSGLKDKPMNFQEELSKVSDGEQVANDLFGENITTSLPPSNVEQSPVEKVEQSIREAQARAKESEKDGAKNKNCAKKDKMELKKSPKTTIRESVLQEIEKRIEQEQVEQEERMAKEKINAARKAEQEEYYERPRHSRELSIIMNSLGMQSTLCPDSRLVSKESAPYGGSVSSKQIMFSSNSSDMEMLQDALAWTGSRHSSFDQSEYDTDHSNCAKPPSKLSADADEFVPSRSVSKDEATKLIDAEPAKDDDAGEVDNKEDSATTKSPSSKNFKLNNGSSKGDSTIHSSAKADTTKGTKHKSGKGKNENPLGKGYKGKGKYKRPKGPMLFGNIPLPPPAVVPTMEQQQQMVESAMLTGYFMGQNSIQNAELVGMVQLPQGYQLPAVYQNSFGNPSNISSDLPVQDGNGVSQDQTFAQNINASSERHPNQYSAVCQDISISDHANNSFIENNVSNNTNNQLDLNNTNMQLNNTSICTSTGQHDSSADASLDNSMVQAFNSTINTSTSQMPQPLIPPSTPTDMIRNNNNNYNNSNDNNMHDQNYPSMAMMTQNIQSTGQPTNTVVQNITNNIVVPFNSSLEQSGAQVMPLAQQSTIHQQMMPSISNNSSGIQLMQPLPNNPNNIIPGPPRQTLDVGRDSSANNTLTTTSTPNPMAVSIMTVPQGAGVGITNPLLQMPTNTAQQILPTTFPSHLDVVSQPPMIQTNNLMAFSNIMPIVSTNPTPNGSSTSVTPGPGEMNLIQTTVDSNVNTTISPQLNRNQPHNMITLSTLPQQNPMNLSFGQNTISSNGNGGAM